MNKDEFKDLLHVLGSIVCTLLFSLGLILIVLWLNHNL